MVRSPAKINLSLFVGDKRPDGFHELETVMAKLNFYDTLLIEPSGRNALDFKVNGDYWAPEGEENLVCKAYHLLEEKTGKQPNVKITLTKNIPAGSGLGSASSDAAAAILGLNQWLNLGMREQEIREKTALLGSDVTFFTGKPLALCTGRGEKIKEIEKNFDFFAILLLPDIIISTKEIYENFVPDTQLYEKLRTKTKNSVNRTEDLNLQTGVNMLAESVFSLHPELKELKDKAETLTEKPFYLTGSGAGLYTVFAPEENGEIEKTKNILDNGVSCRSVTVCNNRW